MLTTQITQLPALKISLIGVLVLLASACSKKNYDALVANSKPKCDYTLGEYRLSESSSHSIPYHKFKNVVFVDSLGNLDTFEVSHKPQVRQPWIQYVYGGLVKGDTVKYCYTTEHYSFRLASKKSGLEFTLKVSAKPLCLEESRVCTDTLSGQTVHTLDIVYSDKAANPTYSIGIFHKIINQVKSRTALDNQAYAEIAFFNKTFSQVERTTGEKKYGDKILRGSILFYNSAEGIVAFSINGQKTWRFFAVF